MRVEFLRLAPDWWACHSAAGTRFVTGFGATRREAYTRWREAFTKAAQETTS